jgi:hypothetical protein
MNRTMKRLTKLTGFVLVSMLGATLLTATSSAADSPESTPAAEQPAADVHIPTAEEAKSFTFMTSAQYAAKYGAEKLAEGRRRAQAIAEATNKAQAEAANPKKARTGSERQQVAAATAAATVVCGSHPGNWYDVVHGLYFHDLSGNIIPLRVGRSDAQWQGGDTGANYNHASVDHNLCNLNAFYSMFTNNHRGPLHNGIADRYEYDTLIVDNNLDVEQQIDGSASAATHGFGDNTPDGRAFGMVTAYCLGYTRCPAWVNAVSGPLG